VKSSHKKPILPLELRLKKQIPISSTIMPTLTFEIYSRSGYEIWHKVLDDLPKPLSRKAFQNAKVSELMDDCQENDWPNNLLVVMDSLADFDLSITAKIDGNPVFSAESTQLYNAVKIEVINDKALEFTPNPIKGKTIAWLTHDQKYTATSAWNAFTPPFDPGLISIRLRKTSDKRFALDTILYAGTPPTRTDDVFDPAYGYSDISFIYGD
jgi:hypothetical protein